MKTSSVYSGNAMRAIIPIEAGASAQLSRLVEQAGETQQGARVRRHRPLVDVGARASDHDVIELGLGLAADEVQHVRA